jgi:hypothetical protein
MYRCIYVFHMVLRITSNYFPNQHQQIGLCNEDEFVYCEVGTEFLNIICRIKTSVIIEFRVIEFLME